MATVLDGVNHRAVAVHLLQFLLHAFIDLYSSEQPVKEPTQKETGLMIEHIGVTCIRRLLAH